MPDAVRIRTGMKGLIPGIRREDIDPLALQRTAEGEAARPCQQAIIIAAALAQAEAAMIDPLQRNEDQIGFVGRDAGLFRPRFGDAEFPGAQRVQRGDGVQGHSGRFAAAGQEQCPPRTEHIRQHGGDVRLMAQGDVSANHPCAAIGIAAEDMPAKRCALTCPFRRVGRTGTQHLPQLTLIHAGH